VRSEEIEETTNWIILEFAKKYGEACKEKDEEKKRALKGALNGALRGFEQEVLLSKMRKIDVIKMERGGE